MKTWLISAAAVLGFAAIAAGANAADINPGAAILPAVAGCDATPAAAGPGEAAQDAETAATATPSWTAFHEFLFDFDSRRIEPSDKQKITEIAAYMTAHPEVQLGVDGSADPHGNGLRNQTLTDGRIAAVHDALIHAGVPADRIHLGDFADPGLRRDRQVEVVLGAGS